MILSLDIGGTNIRSAIVTKTKLSEYKKIKTPKRKKQIIKLIKEIIESYKKPDKICISLAGIIRNKKIQHALNTNINELNLSKILKEKFRIPIYLDNDANCAGLAELSYGTGKNLNNFILLTLGTGIGGAIIINKKLYRGNGAAGEIGSMIIQDKKIFEDFASGNASIELAKKIGLKTTSSEIELKADKGDKKALAVYQQIGEFLGIGLANLAHIFDPDAIILGGGFSRVKHIHSPAKKTFEKLYDIPPKPKILKTKFGDDAGLIGAALLPKQN